MTTPVVESLTVTAFATGATAHLVAMPATVNASDLLIILFANAINDTVTTPANWNLLHSTVGGTTVTLSGYYKIAVGNEDGTTVDVVTVGTRKAVAHTYRISAWHGTTPPEVGTGVTLGNDSPNPPNLAPSWGAEDTLWLAVYGASGNITASAYPTDFTDGADDGVAPTAAASIGSARRALNAASLDPGVFTISSSQVWVAQTVAIRPSAGAATQNLTGALFTKAPTFPTGALSQAPAAPSVLSATATGTTTVDVAWTDNSSDETSFRIERSPNGSTGWATVGTNAANDNTFTNGGLTCGTQYFYRVFAVNAVGDSAASNSDDATTSACPPPAPSTGGNRMGGTGAIRKPPRNVGR